MIDGHDLYNGLLALGYEDYGEPLRRYLNKRTEHVSFCTGCQKGLCQEKGETISVSSQPIVPVPITVTPPEIITEQKSRRGGRKKALDTPNPADSTITPGTIPIVSEKPKSQGKKLRADWTNPAFVAEVLKSLELALHHSNPEEFITSVSKRLYIPKRQLEQKFKE